MTVASDATLFLGPGDRGRRSRSSAALAYAAATMLLFVLGFGALALAAPSGIASLGGSSTSLADVFRASMLVGDPRSVGVFFLRNFGATKTTDRSWPDATEASSRRS